MTLMTQPTADGRLAQKQHQSLRAKYSKSTSVISKAQTKHESISSDSLQGLEHVGLVYKVVGSVIFELFSTP